MNKKVGICTLFTGYNFGSALQAYATKTVLNEMGYSPRIIKVSGSIIGGRDIRIKKTLCTIIRMLLYSNNKKKVLSSFTENGKSNLDSRVINEFDSFYKKSLKPYYISYKKLKREANSPEWCAFVCGSDQVWNSSSFYVDPFYYLDFAPNSKRIAYAPSFGRDYIPEYNKRKIKKYLDEIQFLSVREKTGKNIIKNLIGKEAEVCLDPTLLLRKDDWNSFLGTKISPRENYILCYFLNKPNKKARDFIHELSNDSGLEEIFINKPFGDDVIYCGPEGFLNCVKNAEYIITDSFHGVAFSLIFNKKFFVFDRQYLTENQSTRIKSLLDIIGLPIVFEFNGKANNVVFDYKRINKTINDERKKSLDYLKKSLKGVLNESQ